MSQPKLVKTGSDLLLDNLSATSWPLMRQPYLLETSLPGVFAVGDVRSGSVKRVASAVGEGSIAISFVHRVLQELELSHWKYCYHSWVSVVNIYNQYILYRLVVFSIILSLEMFLCRPEILWKNMSLIHIQLFLNHFTGESLLIIWLTILSKRDLPYHQIVKLTKKRITRTGDYYFLNSLIMDLNQIPCHNMSYNFKSKFSKNTYIFEHGAFY